MNDQHLLLDTQAVVAWAQGVAPAKIVSMIQKGVRPHVSMVSLWEFLLKKNRFQDIGISFADIQRVVGRLGAALLSVELHHLQTLEQLPFLRDHRDPFDRLLISQAISERFILVGKDRIFAQFTKIEAGKSLQVMWD